MADIKVEPKRPSVWPWVIGLIVLAVVIWFVVEQVRRKDATGQQSSESGSVQVARAPAFPVPALG